MSKAKNKKNKSNTQHYYDELEEEFNQTSIKEKFDDKIVSKEPYRPKKPSINDADNKDSPVSEFYKKTFSKTPHEEIMREYAERMFLKKGNEKDTDGANT
jgi:hypothetical protein